MHERKEKKRKEKKIQISTGVITINGGNALRCIRLCVCVFCMGRVARLLELKKKWRGDGKEVKKRSQPKDGGRERAVGALDRGWLLGRMFETCFLFCFPGFLRADLNGALCVFVESCRSLLSCSFDFLEVCFSSLLLVPKGGQCSTRLCSLDNGFCPSFQRSMGKSHRK